MPIYEYQCQKCGEVSEFIQKMSDPPMTECEACGGSLSRLISKSAFHLKGGGWYKDLYASPRGDNGKADTPATPANGGKSDGATAPAGGAAADSGTSAESPKKGSDSATPATSTPATSTPAAAAKD